MGKDFTYALKVLNDFREAGIKPSTIESIIHNSQLVEQDKRVISILNKDQARKTRKFPDANFKTYFCYEAISEDRIGEFNPCCLTPYTTQVGNISYN